MTEQEWLQADNVNSMFEFLRITHKIARTKGGKRRLRLFGCACLRRVWDQADEETQHIVEQVELVCDRPRPELHLKELLERAIQLCNTQWLPSSAAHIHIRQALMMALSSNGYPVQSVAIAAETIAFRSRLAVATNEPPFIDPLRPIPPEHYRQIQEASIQERAWQRMILRDIFNPFHSWPKRTFPAEVRGLAQSCNEGDWAVLPMLIDALADLGEERAVTHLHQPVHVKGCQVIDWILGVA
jgi:hypothetical protein